MTTKYSFFNNIYTKTETNTKLEESYVKYGKAHRKLYSIDIKPKYKIVHTENNSNNN